MNEKIRMPELFARACEAQGDWRLQKAEEHPDDPRNGEWATNLFRMAEWVRGLPNDDERLARILLADVRDVAFLGDRTSQELSRCAVNTDKGFDALLDRLAVLAEEDAREIAQFAGVGEEEE